MTVEHHDAPHRERKPLPTKEQIEAISDIPALEAMQEEVDRRIKKIEVDLEFEVGDEDWDSRARGALAAHRICMGHVGRRLGFLRARTKPDKGTAEHLQAKAQKTLANAERQRAHAESVRAAKDHKQIALATARLELLDRTTFQSFFMRSAAKLLDPEMFDKIMADATLRQTSAIRTQVTLPRTVEAKSAEEPARIPAARGEE